MFDLLGIRVHVLRLCSLVKENTQRSEPRKCCPSEQKLVSLAEVETLIVEEHFPIPVFSA